MLIPLLPSTPAAEHIPALLDTLRLPFETVGHANWPTHPARPEAKVRLACTQSHLLVHFRASEPCTRATFGTDGEDVWTDSCMEIFISTGQGDEYINIECNCIGTLLAAKGNGRQNRTPLTKEQIGSIRRWASLGRTPFGLRNEPTRWETALAVPLTLVGQPAGTLRFNVYKCGDALPTPHFLSLFPIHTPQPDFHQPAFFQSVPIG